MRAIIFGTGGEGFRNPRLRAGPLAHGGPLTEVVSDEPGPVQPEQSGQQPPKPQIVSRVHTADSLNARDAVKLIRSSVRCPLPDSRELSPGNNGSTNCPKGVVGGGTGWETLYDLYNNKKAGFSYDFALYNQPAPSFGSISITAYEGLVTGFSRGDTTFAHYSAGRSRCSVAPVPLLGVETIVKPFPGFAEALCGAAQEPWQLTGLMENEVIPQFVPGRIWSFLFEGSLTLTAAQISTPSVVYARYYGPFNELDLTPAEREYALQKIGVTIGK